MLTVEEARSLVLAHSRVLQPRRVNLADALDLALAEPIVADLDLPPFDKALVDGYAVRASDCVGEGPHRLRVGQEIVAGKVATRPLDLGEAAVIMTGAPLPLGADAVVMHEKTRVDAEGFLIIPGPIKPGDGRMEQAREMRRGQVLFEPFVALDAAKLGVLASVGRTEVLVRPRPRVIIIPTGDELVPIAATPGPGQIRETNSVVLAGLARKFDCEPIVHPVAPDERIALSAAVAAALADRPDVLLLCGGVSAGKRDLVPEALTANGVETLFHKVRLKPGKPILFGVRSGDGFNPTLVFGLPGNPVSGIVGFLLFVAPAIGQLLGGGLRGGRVAQESATLTAPFRQRGDRETYHPASVRRSDDDTLWASPLEWAGSADLYTAARASGFIRFPAVDRDYQAGDHVEVLWYP